MIPHFLSLNEYIKENYGVKMYRLALNGGMSCPNRDGLIDTRGCIFCSAGGSGDFASDASLDIDEQIESAKSLIASKYTGSDYIAYFQAFTNTYAPISYLRSLYTRCIERDDIRILSIATRPDCLNSEIIELLTELNNIKPVWVELGLQTINEETASYIRRGYPLSVYDEATRLLKAANIPYIVHMIIGLPGETADDAIATARYIARSGASGIKLQLLHILKGTDLALDYEKGLFKALSFEEYIDIVASILQVLPPDMVVHRITGDGPKRLLIAPLWTADKKRVYNDSCRYLREHDIRQGSHFVP